MRVVCGGACRLIYVCCVLVAAVRYTQAMIYEYPKAFRPLADMYYEGRATSKDLEMAKRLYKKAAKNGDELAQKKYLPRPVSCVVRRVRWCVSDLITTVPHTDWRNCALCRERVGRRRWRSTARA